MLWRSDGGLYLFFFLFHPEHWKEIMDASQLAPFYCLWDNSFLLKGTGIFVLLASAPLRVLESFMSITPGALEYKKDKSLIETCRM